MLRAFPITILALSLALSSASARFIPFWPYEKLMSKADVVVIATPIATAATKETMTDERWPAVDFVGVNTEFNVLSVLKGKSKVKDGKLTLFHYRLQVKPDPPDVILIDGPSLVSFKIIPRQKDQVQIPALWAGHLLFLKSRKDGRFEAVTGQIDPQYSVRELRLPPTVE